MNVKELARRLPSDVIAAYAASEAWCGSCADGTDWIRSAADPREVSRARSRLSARAAGALTLVVCRYGPLPFEAEAFAEAASAAGVLSKAESRLGLEELRASGIMFTVRKTWGDRLHFLPADAFLAWTGQLLPFAPEPIAPEAARAVRTRDGYRSPYSLQLLQAMASLSKAGLSVTAKGVLHKRAVAAAEARLEFGGPDVEPLGLHFAYRDAYPPAFALCLDAVIGHGWLAWKSDAAVWDIGKLAGWLGCSADERERRLYVWCIGRYAAYSLKFAHAAAALAALYSGSWYRETDLDHWLAAALPPGTGEGWRGWLQALSALGWLQRGTSAGGEAVFRPLLSAHAGEPEEYRPELEEPIRLQPAGGIAVPPGTPYNVRWELELLAEQTAPGPMALYRCSAGTVARYIGDGRTREEAIALLERASGEPLGAEWRGLLEAWAAGACRTSLAEAALLCCDSAAIADRAAAEPKVAPLLGERLGERHFLVERSDLKELQKQLERAGLAPGRRGEGRAPHPGSFDGADRREADNAGAVASVGPGEASDAPSADGAGLVYPSFPMHLYALDTAPAEPDQLLPGLSDVPAAWVKQLREYHATTRREIITKAIELGIAVRLVREGRTLDFVPDRLQEGAGVWSVSGKLRSERGAESVRLTPDMWSGMQLCVPDRLPLRKKTSLFS